MPIQGFESISDQKSEEKREEKMTKSHISPFREKALEEAVKSFQSQVESGVIARYTEDDIVKRAYSELHHDQHGSSRPYPVEYERDIKQLREDYETLIRQNPQPKTGMDNLPPLKETEEFRWQKYTDV